MSTTNVHYKLSSKNYTTLAKTTEFCDTKDKCSRIIQLNLDDVFRELRNN